MRYNIKLEEAGSADPVVKLLEHYREQYDAIGRKIDLLERILSLDDNQGDPLDDEINLRVIIED